MVCVINHRTVAKRSIFYRQIEYSGALLLTKTLVAGFSLSRIKTECKAKVCVCVCVCLRSLCVSVCVCVQWCACVSVFKEFVRACVLKSS